MAVLQVCHGRGIWLVNCWARRHVRASADVPTSTLQNIAYKRKPIHIQSVKILQLFWLEHAKDIIAIFILIPLQQPISAFVASQQYACPLFNADANFCSDLRQLPLSLPIYMLEDIPQILNTEIPEISSVPIIVKVIVGRRLLDMLENGEAICPDGVCDLLDLGSIPWSNSTRGGEHVRVTAWHCAHAG